MWFIVTLLPVRVSLVLSFCLAPSLLLFKGWLFLHIITTPIMPSITAMTSIPRATNIITVVGIELEIEIGTEPNPSG